MTSKERPSVNPRGLLALMAASSWLFLLFVLVVFLRIKATNDRHMIYALDDPYIHLALSEQIAHGHYGINQGEFSSPSSSILWPFLLAPFAGYGFQVYLPLVLNVLFGLFAVLLIALAVDRWLPETDQRNPADRWVKLSVVVLLMFVGNLVSLSFVGMEHVLQVLLAIAIAIGLTFAWDTGRIPLWCLAAAAIAPSVRYEDLSLTLAVSLTLAAMSRKRTAALLFLISVLPLILFGLFLHHLGLPVLPTSTIVKGSINPHSVGVVRKALELLRYNFLAAWNSAARWPVMALGIILCFFFVNERDRTHRAILLSGVVVAALQMSIGKFQWFNRYEVYALVFLAILFSRAVIASPPVRYAPFLLGLFCLAGPYIAATNETAQVTHEVYLQQFQIHRFVSDFYRKNVVLNDIGLPSYRRPAGVYVLDVVGLASQEAATTTNKTAAWLSGIADRHHAELAIIYPQWFQIPASWTPVGKMCNPVENRVIGGQCVVFYSTSPDSLPEIRNDLARYVTTLPKEVYFEFDPPRSTGGTFIPHAD